MSVRCLPLLAGLLAAHALMAERHATLKDAAQARSLREKYLTMTDGWAKFVTFTPGETAAMKAGRKWDDLLMHGPDDPISKRILAAGEPSFESLAARYPGKVLDRTLLGSYSDPRGASPGYDDEFTIWWNGAISSDLFKGPLTDRLGSTGVAPVAHNTNVVFRVGPDREIYGEDRNRFSSIGYENGYLPVVTSVYECQGIRYRQIAFADRPEGETRGWDIAFVQFEIENTTARAHEAQLSEDVLLIDDTQARADGLRILDASGAVLLVHSDTGAVFDSTAQRISHKITLGPRERRRIVLKIPYVPDSARLLKSATPDVFEAAHARVRGFWEKLLAAGARISVPEARVNDMWRALLLQNFVIADGPRFTYGSGLRYNDSTYPQESNFGAHTFAMYGFKDYADALQPNFIPMSLTREGAGRKYQNRRAMLLHHLLENWRLTGRTDVFEKFRDDFYRVAEEIISERRSTMQESGGEKPLHWGLLPPDKPGVDVQASTQQVYVLGHNITNCQGLQDFGTFLARTGIDPDRGNRYLREAKDFRATLMSVMERAAIRIPGRPPFVDLQTLYFRTTPDYGPEPYDDLGLGRLQGAYYHYWVDMEFHYNFFNPADQVGHWLADYVQQRNGFVLGCTRGARHEWSPYGWINNVYDGGYYNYRLRCGDVNEFLLGFYAKMAFGMTRHVMVASEGSPFVGYNTALGGFASADYSFPNSAANSDTLLMLRNMLVYEELDSNVETGRVFLLRGVPRNWMEDGKRISAERLATYYGDISFDVRSALREKKIVAEIRLPRHPLLRSVAVSIRHPQSAPIRAVRVNGRPHTDFDAREGVVRVDAASGSISVEVTY